MKAPEDRPLGGRPRPIDDDAMRTTAAQWVVRCDRGLSPQEERVLAAWREADPRHAVALASAQADWSRLDRFPLEAVSGAGGTRRSWQRWCGAVGLAAAAVVVALWLWPGWPAEPSTARTGVQTLVAGREVRTATLPDGSQVMIKAGGVVLAGYRPAERTVRLLRGEAHFIVAKNPRRPFVVRADGAEIRAVGTAFNVRLASDVVDVLVTEGQVRVGATEPKEPRVRSTEENAAATTKAARGAALLKAGERALIALRQAGANAGPAVKVATVEAGEMLQSLAWHEPLLRLGGATLAEIASEFERRTGHRLVLADPQLAAIRVGGFFRPDDVDGFIHLLESTFGIKVERHGPNETLLSLKR